MSNIKHLETRTPLYRVWLGIKRRCLNPMDKDFHSYGGRGITIYDEWANNYVAFATYVRANLGERPGIAYSIDRIENNEGYIPGNIRWATSKTQSNNTYLNLIVEFKGERLPLDEWAKRTGIKYQTLYARIHKLKWPVEKALTLPLLPPPLRFQKRTF